MCPQIDLSQLPRGLYVHEHFLYSTITNHLINLHCTLNNNFIVMDEGLLDISKIPRFEFQLHNEQLTNCIKELHFQLKAQEKRLEKCRKDIDLKLNENSLADLFQELTAAIDIHPQLLKGLPVRSEGKQYQDELRNSSGKFGVRLGQFGDVLRVLSDKLGNVERRLQQSQAGAKQQIVERVQAVQGQLEQFKKSQARQNRTQADAVMLVQNRFQQKLKEVESKTLWQINDCKVKLSDRVNEQFVKDQNKQIEIKILNKVREATGRNAVDPQTIDALQSRCIRLEKDLEVKVVEMAARVNELRDSIENSLATKKEIGQQKLQTQKRIGNLQLAISDLTRRVKNCQGNSQQTTEDLKNLTTKHEAANTELEKVGKLVGNLKLSDDFQKLMQNLDPHKICEIDTSIATIGERMLKDQKEVDALRRYVQKIKQKMDLSNVFSAADHPPKLDKDEIGRILQELLTGHSAFKKVALIEGQLFEFRAYGESINELNKRISKLSKEFDIQPMIYGLRGLQEFIKKELLVVNGRVTTLEGQFNEEKRRRPLSAKKASSDTKISSSVSFKRLVPVDCISCFQNPIGERTPDRYRK